MKVWCGFGSEHSMNLVMIGHFDDVTDAARANQVIEWLGEQVRQDTEAGLMAFGEPTHRFTDGMSELLGRIKEYSVRPDEVEQFAYDVSIKIDGKKMVLRTEESDVSAFLKVLLDEGARVEVYSAHRHPAPDERVAE
jgi:hypothetical protein